MVHEKRGPRVEAEAAALVVARHPGVVELVGSADGVLRTTMIEGARTLADGEKLTPDEVAGVVASLASTLADLHGSGVVHGGIEASHVLLDQAGRPVLCSLGRGGEPAADVAAVGHLLRQLLDAGPPGSEPRAGRPGPGRRGLGPMLAPPAATVLSRLAEQAVAGDPAARPSAKELAAAIRDGVPTARWPAREARSVLAPAPVRAQRERRRPWVAGHRPEARRPATPTTGLPAGRATGRAIARAFGRGGLRLAGLLAAVVAANVLLVAGVVVISNLLADSPGGAPTPIPPHAPAGRPARRRSPLDGAAPAGDHATTTSLPVAVRVWPPEPLDFRDGVLTVDGVRYAIGRPGDAVVAGDWACTGRRDVALLRPDTGQVFAFDTWPAGDEDATARLVATVAGASGLRSFDADGDGCDDLEVSRPAAAPVLVDAAPVTGPRGRSVRQSVVRRRQGTGRR